MVHPLEPPLRWWCHDDLQSNSHRKRQCHFRHLSVSIAKLADIDWHRMRDVHLGPDLLNLSSVRAPMIFRWWDQTNSWETPWYLCDSEACKRWMVAVAHHCHEKQFWPLRWHCSHNLILRQELGSLRHIASSMLFPLKPEDLLAAEVDDVGSRGWRHSRAQCSVLPHLLHLVRFFNYSTAILKDLLASLASVKRWDLCSFESSARFSFQVVARITATSVSG